jgi:hypothetical protein
MDVVVVRKGWWWEIRHTTVSGGLSVSRSNPDDIMDAAYVAVSMCSLSAPSKRWFSTTTKRCIPVFPTTSNTQLVKHRVCLRDSETAAQVAESFVPAGTKDKVIIEAFPGMYSAPSNISWTDNLVGPGILTRALLQLPRERIRKIIVLENAECFLDNLRVCIGFTMFS